MIGTFNAEEGIFSKHIIKFHFIGAAVLSFTAGVKAEPGDVFEIDVPAFGAPLRNPLAVARDEGMVRVRTL